MTAFHPYWPLLDSTYIDYQVLSIKGVCKDGDFSITERSPYPFPDTVRMSVKEMEGMRACIHHRCNEPPIITQNNTLYECQDGSRFGEISHMGYVNNVPIPLLDDAQGVGT